MTQVDLEIELFKAMLSRFALVEYIYICLLIESRQSSTATDHDLEKAEENKYSSSIDRHS